MGMVIRLERLLTLEVFDGPPTGAGLGVHGRGTGSDDCDPTRFSHEAREEVWRQATAALDFPAAPRRRNRIPGHGTGTTCRLADAVHGRHSSGTLCGSD